MVRPACPTEHELLARANGRHDAAAQEDIDAHLADCSECRIVVSELVRTSRIEAPLARDPAVTAPATPNAARPRVAEGELVGGKYRVNHVLGTGGMGLVVEATHDLLGTRVAIKVPAVAVRDDPEIRARLLREARMVARLEGDYVGRVLDAGILPDGFPFVVFERLDGQTLAERLGGEGRLGVTEAVDAVIEACAGLAEAHAAGIVHRDVKPSNLFEARRADGSARIRVIDFGIAKSAGDGARDATQSGVVLGTPAYMAPEQVSSSRAVDARADVWALGMTLVELLTATPPTVASFAATLSDDAGALVHAIAVAGAGRRDAIAIARVIARCLRASPEDRYATVDALARALAPFAGARGRAALASIDGTGSHAPLPRRRSRRVLALAAGIALAAVVAGIFASVRRGPIDSARVTSGEARVAPATIAATETIAHASAPASSAAEPSPLLLNRATSDPPRAISSAASSRAGAHASKPAAATVPAAHAEPAASAARDPNGLGDRK